MDGVCLGPPAVCLVKNEDVWMCTCVSKAINILSLSLSLPLCLSDSDVGTVNIVNNVSTRVCVCVCVCMGPVVGRGGRESISWRGGEEGEEGRKTQIDS